MPLAVGNGGELWLRCMSLQHTASCHRPGSFRQGWPSHWKPGQPLPSGFKTLLHIPGVRNGFPQILPVKHSSHSDAKSNLGLFYLSSHTSPHSAAAAKSVIHVPQTVDRTHSVQNSRPPTQMPPSPVNPVSGAARRLEARVGRTYTWAHSRGWAVGSGPHWPRHVAWASHNTDTGFRGGTSPKQTS